MGVAVIPMVLAGASALISAAGAKQQADAQARASEYQAAVAQQNQQVANQYADMEKARGEQLAQQKQTETAQREGAMQTAIAANGLDTGTGSALRLSNDTLAMGDLDARTIRYNASKAAYGYQTQSVSYGNQASLDMMAAQDARNSGNLGAFSSIISGAASVSDKWAKYKTGVA